MYNILIIMTMHTPPLSRVSIVVVVVTPDSPSILWGIPITYDIKLGPKICIHMQSEQIRYSQTVLRFE